MDTDGPREFGPALAERDEGSPASAGPMPLSAARMDTDGPRMDTDGPRDHQDHRNGASMPMDVFQDDCARPARLNNLTRQVRITGLTDHQESRHAHLAIAERESALL